MSKSSLFIIILILAGALIGYGSVFYTLLNEIERSAVHTLDTYCGPEAAHSFETRSIDCE